MIDLYPTRIQNGKYEFLQRVDPVVYGTPGAMTPFQRESYSACGYTLLKGFLNRSEVDDLVDASDGLFWDAGRELHVVKEPGSDVVRSVFGIHGQSPIKELANHRKLNAIAREICGGDTYIHQSRINFKSPMQSTGWTWHSDFETWHAEDGMPRMRCVSAMICIDDNTHFNGPLMVIPGSHKSFLSCPGETPDANHIQHLAAQVVGVPDEASMQTMLDNAGGVIDIITAKAGDVLLFDCNLMHGSGSNVSPWPRANLTFVFNAVQNAIVEPFCGRSHRPAHVASTPSMMKAGAK